MMQIELSDSHSGEVTTTRFLAFSIETSNIISNRQAIATVTLDCGIVTVRPWHRGDEGQLVEAADNPNVARYMRDTFPSPYTTADAVEYIERNEAADPKTHFAIALDNRIAGGVGYVLHDSERRIVADFGYWLGEQYWGQGIATAACRAVTDYAFDRHGLRRIESAVYAPNVASRRVLEKCGYQREGLMRNAIIKNGEVLDAYLYAIVRGL
jgi:[ribosomal protein S5]-alanine N-acetyltransferase